MHIGAYIPGAYKGNNFEMSHNNVDKKCVFDLIELDLIEAII